MALIGRERAAAVPAAAVRGSDREVRIGQARPALRHGDQGSFTSAFAMSSFSRLPRRDRGGRRGPRICRAGRRALFAHASSTSSSSRRSSLAPPVWSGRGAAEGAVQSSALKAAGEPAIRRRSNSSGAGPGDLLLMAAGPARADVGTAWPAPAAASPEGEPARSGRVRVPLGRRLPDVRVAATRSNATSSCTTRSRRRSRATPALLETDPGRGAGASLRPRAERQRDRRRQHPNSRPGAAAADLQAAQHLTTKKRSCASASSSRRSSTARRRMAASRSASIASSRSWPARARSATSSPSRRRRRPSISWPARRRPSTRGSCGSCT